MCAGPVAAEPVSERDEAYDRLVARGEPDHLRAAIEEALILLTGTAWYWIDRERQVADWDYPSIEQRLTFEAWRLDNNPFGINFAWHAFDGAMFHVVARSNDVSLLGAFGYGMATSLAWEFLLEFREKVSINDVIVTPGGGVAIGEFLHWLGRYLSSGERGGGARVARWTLGGFHALHGSLDRRDLRLAGPRDALGLSADIWHRFVVHAGVSHNAIDGQLGDATIDRALFLEELTASGELVAIPGYLAPGTFSRGFRDGNVSALELRATLGNGRPGIDALADLLLLGRHWQSIDEDGRGRALTVGLDLAYRYRREDLPGFRDRLGLMHLPGLAVDGHMILGELHLRGQLRVNPDFVGVEAFAYPLWRAANPDETEKTILRKQGYYYGWGGSTRLAFELVTPRVTVGTALRLGRYTSIDGVDKSQEEVTADVGASDTVADGEAWLAVAPLRGRLHLELRGALHGRDSEVGGFRADHRLRRLTLALGARF